MLNLYVLTATRQIDGHDEVMTQLFFDGSQAENKECSLCRDGWTCDVRPIEASNGMTLGHTINGMTVKQVKINKEPRYTWQSLTLAS